ncbi:hypothetical protein QVD17_16167 [Tagetes erecta]|uniref:Uncharacterized protein n=1 Tax=Tagetes erecta TaxID=13708 RepID=A0AAD8KUI4_TARER|nr:hypothetical protein QVD17_16167 [Tagetes erecta]
MILEKSLETNGQASFGLPTATTFTTFATLHPLSFYQPIDSTNCTKFSGEYEVGLLYELTLNVMIDEDDVRKESQNPNSLYSSSYASMIIFSSSISRIFNAPHGLQTSTTTYNNICIIKTWDSSSVYIKSNDFADLILCCYNLANCICV